MYVFCLRGKTYIIFFCTCLHIGSAPTYNSPLNFILNDYIIFFCRNIEKVVVVKDDDKQKHKNIEIHFKDGVRSMIMDFKMPPHYHRQGDNNMYNLDLNKLVRQLTSTTKDEIVSARLLAMKIQQKNNPHLNVNYDEIVNLATFFSSGRDTVDYGYSLDSIGKSMVEDELNSLPRVDKGDVMNINFVGTENTSDATSTRIYKSPIDTQSPDIIIFPTDTENIESSTACDTDVSIHLELNLFSPTLLTNIINKLKLFFYRLLKKNTLTIVPVYLHL